VFSRHDDARVAHLPDLLNPKPGESPLLLALRPRTAEYPCTGLLVSPAMSEPSRVMAVALALPIGGSGNGGRPPGGGSVDGGVPEAGLTKSTALPREAEQYAQRAFPASLADPLK
jgi:hypothetical protein